MIERRRGRRFHVNWPVRVEGIDAGGAPFTESGLLNNISSSGALLTIPRPLPAGTRLDVYIDLPTQGRKKMKYSASVVRVESEASLVGAAVSFDALKPEFATI